MKGSVRIEDTEGGGATFVVELPLANNLTPTSPSGSLGAPLEPLGKLPGEPLGEPLGKPLGVYPGGDGMEPAVDVDNLPGRHSRPI